MKCDRGDVCRRRKMSNNKFYYSDKYSDDVYEYRHVVLPKDYAQRIPKARLMKEEEWRGLGIQQSLGWETYMIHKPEPHIILFRRKLTPEMKQEKELERKKRLASLAKEVKGKDVMLAGHKDRGEGLARLKEQNTLRQ
ncbi:putative Cyclin-dependent kinases regulatory subunit 2 [Hypsibius exemplaris]|uniref:Cyclin-dependent kinases regulatory subunit n=1 Tax=Hypsibius exemplaris TaxID=2072580 RepID=A0A1W0XCE9_HYPEX|nr:putative Cyclin-dependent kinases regulatory subunit 2 [Hypsibius exemplaris]